MHIDIEAPHMAVDAAAFPEGTLPEFLLLGRSNVGKSSFVNALAKRKNIAYISQKPGKTQTLNFYKVNNRLYLVDAPGYGYASAAKTKRRRFGKMLEDYLMNRAALRHVVLLVDARHPPTEDDVLMAEFLTYHHIPFTVVATKADKLSGNRRALVKRTVETSLSKAEADDVMLFSAHDATGRETFLEKLFEWCANA